MHPYNMATSKLLADKNQRSEFLNSLLSNTGKPMDVFSEPAIKLFCRQLKYCKTLKTEVGQSELERWQVPLKSSITGKETLFHFFSVWIQGTIHKVLNESEVLLKDVSGVTVKIVDCHKMAGGSHWMVEGLYCSVIGCIKSNNQAVCIQAYKMNMLDDNPNLKILWDWEVNDLANEICNGYQ